MDPIIDVYYPYSASTEELERLRNALTSPRERAIPFIFDNEAFRTIFHETERDSRPSLTDLPPKSSFDQIYRKYHSGRLRVVSPNDPRVLRYATNESAMRLFSDVKDEHPNGVERFQPNDFLYNGHKVAWRLFECIVEGLGDMLDLNHPNINWVLVAQDMGRPFEIDPNFARHLCVYYYDCIAPVVSLWLWELRLVQAKQQVLEKFRANQNLHQIPSSYLQAPTGEQIEQLMWSMETLNNELGTDWSKPDFESAEDLVGKIARTIEMRAIIRLLPCHFAKLAMNIVQWVLRQDPTPSLERLKIIKLLQDIASESDEFPDHMCLTGFEQDHTPEISAGEATILFGKINQVVVAIRVPQHRPRGNGLSPWVREKIYKRTVILHQQIRHENLIDIHGLYSHRGQISVVMPRLCHSLHDHILYPENRSADYWVSYGRLAKGVINGLAYLHSHHVVHGDLHWHNLLIDIRQIPKIADLGMSRLLHPGGNSTSTPPYSSAFGIFMPSEILDDHQKERDQNIPRSVRPDCSTDIYSCGIIFLALALPDRGDIVGSTETRLKHLAQQFVDGTSCETPPEELRKLRGRGEDTWKLIRSMASREARPDIASLALDAGLLS